MNLLIQMIVNSIVQIILFLLIPFIWWCMTARKKSRFLSWIGLKKVSNPRENNTFLWMLGTTFIFLVVSVFILYTVRNIETAASEFSGLGMKALPAILVYGILNTSFPEEVLFRGFLLKRISHKWGFSVGNAVQCVLFGVLHGVMFFALTGIVQTMLIIGFTGGIAWCMGYVNEKKANGSILPSWCMHAVANIFSGICSAFVLF